MWFEGRWRASGWDLLGSRFQRRSLQRRRPRDTPLPPPWNLSFLLWWGHVLSVNWCVFFIFYFCICKQQSSVTAGNDVCVEWLHNSRQKTRADWRNPVNFRESRRAAQKWSKWGKFSNQWVFLILTQGLQFTVWCADPLEYHTGDECVVQLLKGLCLRSLGRLVQAEICFNHVISRWACLDVTAIHQKHSSGSLLKVLSRNFYFNNPFNRLLFQELICLMSHLGSSATNQHWGWIGGESRLIRMTVNQWQNGRCADALMHK